MAKKRLKPSELAALRAVLEKEATAKRIADLKKELAELQKPAKKVAEDGELAG